MDKKRLRQGALAGWGVWELFNGYLGTFAQQWGASMVGWKPADGWTDDLVAMTRQYGMSMNVLGGAYLLAATDAERSRQYLSVVIAEQALGISYAAYGVFGSKTVKLSSFAIQGSINLAIAGACLALRSDSTMGEGA